MKTNHILGIIIPFFLLLVVSATAYAETEEKKHENLEDRLQKLETAVYGQEVEKKPNIGDKITFSGVLAVEAGWASIKGINGVKGSVSDVRLDTVELNWGAKINEKTGGNILLLWEEDDTEPIDIDEGVITWQGNGFDITAGRFYPPFGTYNTHFVSDPLTLELGQIQETGIMIHTAPTPRIEAIITVANGGIDKTGATSDHANDIGLRLDFHLVSNQSSSLDLGVQYYTDIADTNAGLTNGARVAKRVPGFGANLDWNFDPWSVNVEYISATKAFSVADLDMDADGAGDKPGAWNFEIGRKMSPTHELALKFEGSSEFFDFPEFRYGLVSNWDLCDGTHFALEYMHGKMDRNFTAGADKGDSLLAHFAIEY